VKHHVATKTDPVASRQDALPNASTNAESVGCRLGDVVGDVVGVHDGKSRSRSVHRRGFSRSEHRR